MVPEISMEEGHTGDDATRQWLERRVDDPDLTEKGKVEAEEFAAYYSRVLGEAKTQVKIYSSPFWRTLQTSLPLAKAMTEGQAVVQPDIYEIGGVYTTGADGQRTGPGKCMAAAEIKALFPSYDVSRLPAEVSTCSLNQCFVAISFSRI